MMKLLGMKSFNPFPAKLLILIFTPFNYSDPQLPVGENYSNINLSQNICKSWCLNIRFFPNNGDLMG